jgi:hypothetical protein
MKRLLPVVLLFHCSVALAYDQVDLLLSDHAVICSPNTPAAVGAHLTEGWGVLIAAPREEVLWQNQGLLEHVAVILPDLPNDPKAAADSMLAWKERWGLSLAVVSMGDRQLNDAASAAGLAVYRQTSAFRRGHVAVPKAGGYEFYAGPSPAFFSEPGYLLRLRTSRTRDADRGKTANDSQLADMADQLAAVFDEAVAADSSRWQTLLQAARTADGLKAETGTADPRAAVYARRWRALLGWWLSPQLQDDSLSLFAGVETDHTFELTSSAEVPVTITDIAIDPAYATVTWRAEIPMTLEPGARASAAGSWRGTAGAGIHMWPVQITCEYDAFRFSRWQGVRVTAADPLSAEFIPPILFADQGNSRNDPNYTVRVAMGQLELKNLTDVPMTLSLDWQAEDPITLSATYTDVTLQQGESRSVGYTLSIPKDLKYKEYDYGVALAESDGYTSELDGHLWRNAPNLDGQTTIGVPGLDEAWRRALLALGLNATPVSTDGLQSADLTAFGALIIQGGVAPPGDEASDAVADFVESGHIAIVDIDPDALEWLPWDLPTIRRPGPFAASFYNEDLAWWSAPNELVGGCFAAASRDSVHTLPAGAESWDPLVVDDSGKGFMYRRRHGRGWFVVVHTGWTDRLARLERRALLGLLNLVSTRNL